MRYSLLIIVVFLMASFAYSNEKSIDTLRVAEQEALTKLSVDYDSLLHSYYVSRSQILFDTLSENIDLELTAEDGLPSDSVIITNMKTMPVFFDLTYNKIVRAYLRVYLKDKRDLTETVLGLSEYYFPHFEEVLDARNMPLELKYLPVIESALNPRAVSRVGATGLWQFMYATGRFLNMEITSFVDERRDVTASTQAAAEYLSSLYAIFGDWPLALAAYNCGPGNVNKAIRRSGGKSNFWDIYYYLPRETRGYLPGFIAVLYIFHHQNELGLTARKIEMPLYTDTVLINRKLHLGQVAQVMQIPISELQDLNPQYRRNVLPGGKSYPLRLPYQRASDFISLQDSIFTYKDSMFFNEDALAKTPTNERYYGDAPSGNFTRLTYTIKPGDNLGFISDWYNVRISDLRYWNGLRGNMIRAGQNLVVFVPKKVASKYNDIDRLSFAEKQRRVGKQVKATPQKTNNNDYPDDGKYLYYVLKNGDTLWDVAKKYEGITDQDILKMNNLTTGRNLKAGQKIRVKRLN